MDKLKMQTANKADENFKQLAEMFPNAVTETTNENGKVVRAIDKDALMQETYLGKIKMIYIDSACGTADFLVSALPCIRSHYEDTMTLEQWLQVWHCKNCTCSR